MSSLESLIDRIYQHGIERESISLVSKWTGGTGKSAIWSCLQTAWADRIKQAVRDDRVESEHEDKLFVWRRLAADSFSFFWADLGMEPDEGSIDEVWTSVEALSALEREVELRPNS